MIIIHALFKVKPEAKDIFITETMPLIVGSRMEEGNISYNLYEDTSVPDTFIMVEEWKDEQAVETHNQTPHFVRFGLRSKPFFQIPTQVKVFSAEEKN
ncbi:antibiotic biosynthesis monooxygenase [Sporolactobacillus shoreae]|uniref:Antibiotic biosynthesis monooxygenase n=1 Tax=Sporolactobacillus shoreae TaxID=1465501 RepID=A0A4Z0GJY3_9BACL|nr:putative quinol monooxygenase [Sporolactobacillus shoreae]TGA96237.1 antibiotic biosynthesis monooxygenase [Sporolactobacillus shoreae]